MRFSPLVMLAPVVVFVGTVLVLLYTAQVLQDQRSDAEVIDVAGRQRTLSELHTKQVLLVPRGVAADYDATRAEFFTNLTALLDGGSVSAGPGREELIDLPPAPTAEIRAVLETSGERMRRAVETADEILEMSPDDPALAPMLEQLIVDDREVLRASSEAMSLLAEYSAARLARLVQWGFRVGALVAVCGMALIWLLSRFQRLNRGLQAEIEQRRQAVEHLRDSEERLRTVVTGVVDGLITTDERGQIISLNPAAERIFGVRAEKLTGKNLTTVMPQSAWTEHTTISETGLLSARGNIAPNEVVGRRGDGSSFPMSWR